MDPENVPISFGCKEKRLAEGQEMGYASGQA
jgi:hypothetical protein